MKIIEEIHAFGNNNILCSHRTTIEITKDSYLTVSGNCIIGINSLKSCNDLNKELKNLIKSGKKIKVTLRVGEIEDYFYGFGSQKLTLLDKKDMVFRKSSYLCDRTVLINCTKASIDIKRDLVEALKESNKKFSIIFEIADSNGED